MGASKVPGFIMYSVYIEVVSRQTHMGRARYQGSLCTVCTVKWSVVDPHGPSKVPGFSMYTLHSVYSEVVSRQTHVGELTKVTSLGPWPDVKYPFSGQGMTGSFFPPPPRSSPPQLPPPPCKSQFKIFPAGAANWSSLRVNYGTPNHLKLLRGPKCLLYLLLCKNTQSVSSR